MKLISLTCSHCGAPLEVPEEAKFVTCTYCSSRLEVHRSGGAVYTQVLESLERRTEKIAEDVETLKLQNRLERLDRDWMLERDQYLVRGKDGGRHLPSKTGVLIMLVFVVGFGIFWTVSAAEIGLVPAICGIFVIGFAVVTLATLFFKRDQYERRRRTYEAERRRLLRAIDSRQSSDM